MSKKQPPTVISAGILAQLSFAIVTALVVPLLAAIALSRLLNFEPPAVLIALAIALALGGMVVYRVVKNAYEQFGGGK